MVLLDICMPEMTGFEFLEHLRADPDLCDTAVVICTALDLEPSEAREVANDAKAVIRKGFNLEGSIEEVVRTILRRTGP
jgi:CheY-like chemotaxis protein